ncbi:MAG: AAA family ATPase [Treponema sp.]|nr:AAA family ATPase [Treponema sp.]
MTKDWTVNELKQKLETDIIDENARKGILKIFANVIEKTHYLNPSNWNISFRTDGGIRFQLNFGYRYVLGIYSDFIITMCEKEHFFSLSQEFRNELSVETEIIEKNAILKIVGEKCIQVKIPFSKCEKYLETLEPAICDFAKWCTENRKKNPQSEDAHVPAFIDYMNQELERSIPQPEYEENNNIIFSTKQKNAILELVRKYENLLELNPNEVFFNEEYKWKIITDCANKKNIEIFDYLIKSKSNLFDLFSIAQASKDFTDDSLKNEILEKLFDENNPLDKRLAEYKILIEQKSNQEKSRIISGERSASVFLTCKNSKDYVFFKSSYYEKLCKYLDIQISIPGEKYSHYLKLIDLIVKIIVEETNLADTMKSFTSKYIQSDKLIVQNMIYVLFDKFNFQKEQGDKQMTDYEKKLDEIKNNLLANKNVILTGAPGTGKTFMAKQIAKELGCEDDNIGFVQFHPSYDYTDFVEGLRPKQVDGSDQIGFERKDGVFKAFCEKALKNLVDSNKTIIQIQKELSWQEKLMIFLDESIEDRRFYALSKNGKIGIENYHEDIIYIQLPDNPVHKSDQIHISKLLKILNSEEKFDRAIDVERFLNGYHSAEYSYLLAIYKAIRDFNFSSFELSSKEIIKQEKKNFVFIIDEINRGEVAKIFGELFYCIDPGYRGEKGRISTQYQNLVTSGEFQKGFFIPENVYIIGTMNDIDRSVESMDFAFRRRFSWIEVKAIDTVGMLDPKYDDNGELIAGLEKDLADEAKRRMENLNAAISKIDDLNDAYHIGASYFLKLNNYDGDFESLWNYHIKGILQEYLRGNPHGKLDDLKSAYDEKEELKAGE